jgi:N-acetylneuraminate synthase
MKKIAGSSSKSMAIQAQEEQSAPWARHEGPYVIAEISANHQGSLERALNLVSIAKKCGADAIKLQTFTADTMTLPLKDKRFLINDASSLWDQRNLWELLRQAETPRSWHEPIFSLARSLDLDAISTAFSADDANFLVSLGVTAIKVSSFELVNIPLLKHLSSLDVPCILSTGMSTEEERDEAITAVGKQIDELALLKCTSAYPSKARELNLSGIPYLQQRYDCAVGFSDHTDGTFAHLVAFGLGARIFERHLIDLHSEESLDNAFSSDAREFAKYCEQLRAGEESLGVAQTAPLPSESASLWERPSILTLRDIEAGTVLTRDMIGVRRPNHGGHPRDLSLLIGKRTTRPLTQGEGVAMKDCQ